MNKEIKKLWRISSRLLSLVAALTFASTLAAQTLQLKGTVKDDTGEPLYGAAVRIVGSQGGVTTDADGQFSISAERGQTLQVTYVGFQPFTQVIQNDRPLVITLSESSVMDEVLVVGYGVQKKSVVTAAIAKVHAEDLESTAPVRVDNALKGLAAGVQVTSASGQPGEAARVRIRGIGTINDSNPIYIVDGMPIEGGIDYLNPTDIESIEVLKDAASGAIYGARAANGVILVTTKKGQLGKTRVTYDFSYGISNPWRQRDVLNATEYAIMMNEGRLNAGMAPLYNDPYSYGEGTDWQKEVFNKNAGDQRHQVSLSGATEKVNYYVSMGYQKQEGIVGGDWDRSNYERLTLRSNTNYVLFDESKERNWLNKLTLTANLSYARIKSKGVSTNSTWGSPLGAALMLSPMLTVYEPDAAAEQAQIEKYSNSTSYTPIYGPDGRMFVVPGADFGEQGNPVASMSLPGSKGWSHKFVANFAADLQLWEGLKFRTSYSVDLGFWGNDSWYKPYYLRNNDSQDHSGASSESSRGTVWQLENVLTYDKTIGDHSFTVLLGQSSKESHGYYLGASAMHLVDYNKPSVSYTTGLREDGERDGWGGLNETTRLASYFGRVNYNYAERYMGEFTIRRDGSSRFGPNNKWATFPSFSVGWNVANESFFENLKDSWFNTLKVRYSWGKNGNESIGNFRYKVLTSSSNNYIFGTGENVVNGVKASGLANESLKWEESEQHNVGLDFGFFGNALTFTIDYFNKRTTGMLMEMNIPQYVGESRPIGNVGKMENSGVEMEAVFKHRFNSDLTLRVAGNLSYLHNKLIEYGNETGWANYDSFQGTGAISRAQNGMPFPYFYGLKTNGIFQTMDEVRNYVGANGQPIQPNAVPGDVRYVDINNDGVINDDDRTDIGNGTPDWTWGLNVNLAWRDFDFSMMWQGTIGNDVYDATRRTDLTRVNLPSYMLNRWTGEGTSDKYPRYVWGDNANWQSNDLYVYDGSYARLKNIQLGYTLPRVLTSKIFIEKLRFYVAAENLLTLTKYHGYDPEISSGGTSLGIDYGVYPQARTFTFGLNVAF